MRISTNKDNLVSFLQMPPMLAQMLLDLSADLAAGRAVVFYREDETTTAPTEDGVRLLESLGRAYDHPLTLVHMESWGTAWTEEKA